MTLYSRLARLEDTLRSRTEIAIEVLRSRVDPPQGTFSARIRFFDGSRLFILDDSSQSDRGETVRDEYIFHYQHADGSLIFRYDNAPHYPDLPTFPAHKHTPDGVIPSPAPDLAEVLREIDEHLYPSRQP